jgi:hypothetical protein
MEINYKKSETKGSIYFELDGKVVWRNDVFNC